MLEINKTTGIFATPESIEALVNYVVSLGNGRQRVMFLTVMGMTWNLAVKLHSEE